jgi:DNA-directed RNA polymerase subunit RPC12/RpoP
MYTDIIEINGEKVKVSVSIVDLKQKYNKCARCSQYNESVDKDALFQMTCDRCSSVLHTFLYDIHYGYNNHTLPPALRTMSSTDFINSFVRQDLRSLSFEELQKL